MIELGLFNDKPIEVKGIKVAPRDVFFKLIPPVPTTKKMESKLKASKLNELFWCMLVEVEVGEDREEALG